MDGGSGAGGSARGTSATDIAAFDIMGLLRIDVHRLLCFVSDDSVGVSFADKGGRPQCGGSHITMV